MCGICGILAPSLHEDALAYSIKRMVADLRHRGPDAKGYLVEARSKVALGHARLSVLDLSTAGSQPMTSESGRYTIVYNGEVYNFNDLRNQYLSEIEFKSTSDTEVVLKLYEKIGVAAFSKLNGMFAIAIHDRVRNKIVLVRDRLGIKPLYIGISKNAVLFASEIKAIISSGLIDREISFAHIHEYLYFGNTLGESTFYKNIYRLGPGCYVEIDPNILRIESETAYWSVHENSIDKTIGFAEAVDSTRQLLTNAVKRQLVSDVPVGVFLSGGIDSTALVAMASSQYSGKLRTYSVGFDYIGDAAELPKAKWVAQRYGTEHHELYVTSNNVIETIEKLSRAHDQPFADPANIPLLQLCNAIDDDTKVILQGDGGDELFGGYRRYSYLAAGRVATSGFKLTSLGLQALRSVVGPKFFGAERFFSALAVKDSAEKMALLLTVESPLYPPSRILSKELRIQAELQDPFERYRIVSAMNDNEANGLQAMLTTDLKILLPDIFLEKVDRATMASSKEIRVPFLDNELVDYVCKLPSSTKVTFGNRKKLLKVALKGIVPDEILNAPKVGFGVPISSWLKGSLKEFARDTLLECAQQGGLFDHIQVGMIFDEHVAGYRDHSQLLWKALQLALWYKNNDLQ